MMKLGDLVQYNGRVLSEWKENDLGVVVEHMSPVNGAPKVKVLWPSVGMYDEYESWLKVVS